MRKWLDKAWAKAAAFVLTLVLGGLTVLGGIGIGILVSYNVFLDDGAYLRQTLYQEQCYDSLSMANDYLCAQLDSVGLLDKSYYFVNTDAADSAEYNPEAAQQLLSELPRLFADAFSRELSSCQLVVSDPDTGETYLANFDLTESDKLLYDTQELYVYHLSESTGLTSIQVAITATLLEKSGQAPSYSYLVCSWLLTHTGLTIFLTVLCGLLTLFCFGFSMASAGHWQNHEGIHLTWLDKVPADVFALALLEIGLYQMNYYGEYFLVLKLVELLAVLAIALNLRTLEKNGKQLSEGDLSTPVDTKRLFGAFRRYGQAMNRLQSGMESAVQEQMRAERMKTELITNVSHDIKTPLTSIVNYVDLLKKEDIPSPAAQEYIAVLDRQSKRLKKLTEDLVEASKASSGALPVDVQPIDVSVLFSQIAGEYQDRLADCHLTLVTQSPEGQPVVAADSKLLSRVMDNLVSNICKYAMPETRVYVSGVVSDGQMTLSFKNVSRAELNISPDELMERFVRGDTSRHTEGSGLGLSIVRSLVQLMGGTFRLSIDADLFRADVTLPLVQQD